MGIYDTDPSDDSRRVFAVAPMIDWTDRRCRFFHRQLSHHALLYTEMITTPAILRGDRERLLGFSPAEHPVALQLGGCDPRDLAAAARIGVEFGYDEINLNVGCPSDRVQDGRFGACLMAEPALVGDCVAEMKAAVPVPVTVKCRIGIDDQDPEPALDALADAVVAAGVDAIWVHARKAWLKGLSPKENRTIPPLDYDRVFRLRARLGAGARRVFVGLNGGIATLEAAQELAQRVDGVMLGRAAYQTPGLLAEVDRVFRGDDSPRPEPEAVAAAMMDYIAAEGARGVPVAAITRHMLGLFTGRPGARAWRRILTVESHRPGADASVVAEALAAVRAAGAARDEAAVQATG